MNSFQAPRVIEAALHGLFVTGTDTEVGKTHVTSLIARRLRMSRLPQLNCVGIYKPVCSGVEFDPDGKPFWSDIRRLSAAMGDQFPLELICPQRFDAAVAPSVAAALEGKSVDRQLLRSGAQNWGPLANILLVEGAGGWLSPIADGETNADLAIDLKLPVLIVAANRLGMINHTLLTVQAVRNAGLTVAGVVVNQVRAAEDTSAASNIQTLRSFVKAPVWGPVPYSTDSSKLVVSHTEEQFLTDLEQVLLP